MKKTKASVKKLIVPMLLIIFVGVAIFSVYWLTTENIREINELKEEISDFRLGKSRSIYISLSKEELEYDIEYMDFIETQVKEMCLNEEYSLLGEFVNALGQKNMDYYTVAEILNKYVPNFKDAESALKMVCKWRDSYHYYASRLELNRNSKIISAYISNLGTNAVSYTPGEGFYANKKSWSKDETIDFPTSKWYDEEGERYFGDFKQVYAYSTNLFTYETSYTQDDYYFRGILISCDPLEDDIVWSGDFFFAFTPTGELTELEELN